MESKKYIRIGKKSRNRVIPEICSESIKTNARKFGRHKCDSMPRDFFADWSPGDGPTLHYEPDDPIESGVSAYFTMEIEYCPFCGEDLRESMTEGGCL